MSLTVEFWSLPCATISSCDSGWCQIKYLLYTSGAKRRCLGSFRWVRRRRGVPRKILCNQVGRRLLVSVVLFRLLCFFWETFERSLSRKIISLIYLVVVRIYVFQIFEDGTEETKGERDAYQYDIIGCAKKSVYCECVVRFKFTIWYSHTVFSFSTTLPSGGGIRL